MSQEQLQSLVLQLTEESCQIRTTQQKLLLELQAQLHAHSSSQTSNTQEELTECRRHSCGDIQQYVQGGLRALEDRCCYCLGLVCKINTFSILKLTVYNSHFSKSLQVTTGNLSLITNLARNSNCYWLPWPGMNPYCWHCLRGERQQLEHW